MLCEAKISDSPSCNRDMIYVVDDDVAVRDSMSVLLESYGLSVELFSSAAAFLRDCDAAEHCNGCLLLDLHMPGMTGIELLESLRLAGNSIPTILMTGRSDSALSDRAERAGIVALLNKPVDDVALVQFLGSALGHAIR